MRCRQSAGGCALDVCRSRPTVALTGSTPGCRPPLRMTREAEVGCWGWCVRRLEIPTCGRPPGSTSGCRPPLRMTRRGGRWWRRGWCTRRSEIPTCGRPDGFDSGLSPSAQDDTKGGMFAQSLDLYRTCWTFGVVFKIRFYAGFPALFFSLKLIKKPSPVGEGEPRQWWMRSSRE